MTVWAYVRVSTTDQAESGLGLAAQRAAIESEAARRGWDVEWVEDAGRSGATLDRPALTAMLAKIRRGDVLVVAKLDRLSRSLMDFAGLMSRAHAEGWAVVALDLGLDLTTPSGELMANVMATFAHFERRLISQRTKEAMAQLKGKKRLGAPPDRG